jgi:hypothetical protein
MIDIDKDRFESVVNAAASASVQVFDSMQDALEKAQQRVYYDVAPKAIIEAGSEDLQNEVARYVCLDAFYNAIPQLDLVLTPTGFGVVSNQNVAPASRDRVSALQECIRDSRDDALDVIIFLLRGNEDWAQTVRASILVPSVMYAATQLQEFAGISGHRTELNAQRPRIFEAEQRIKVVCSSELFEQLLDHIRRDTASKYERYLIGAMREAIGYYLNNIWVGFNRQLEYISNLLEDNLTEFPKYAESKAYKVKHFEGYENKKEDSTYFFG